MHSFTFSATFSYRSASWSLMTEVTHGNRPDRCRRTNIPGTALYSTLPMPISWWQPHRMVCTGRPMADRPGPRSRPAVFTISNLNPAILPGYMPRAWLLSIIRRIRVLTGTAIPLLIIRYAPMEGLRLLFHQAWAPRYTCCQGLKRQGIHFADFMFPPTVVLRLHERQPHPIFLERKTGYMISRNTIWAWLSSPQTASLSSPADWSFINQAMGAAPSIMSLLIASPGGITSTPTSIMWPTIHWTDIFMPLAMEESTGVPMTVWTGLTYLQAVPILSFIISMITTATRMWSSEVPRTME